MNLVNGEVVNQLIRISEKVSKVTGLKYSSKVEIYTAQGLYCISCGTFKTGEPVRIALQDTSKISKEKFDSSEPYLVGIEILEKDHTHTAVMSPATDMQLFNLELSSAMVIRAYMEAPKKRGSSNLRKSEVKIQEVKTPKAVGCEDRKRKY